MFYFSDIFLHLLTTLIIINKLCIVEILFALIAKFFADSWICAWEELCLVHPDPYQRQENGYAQLMLHYKTGYKFFFISWHQKFYLKRDQPSFHNIV